MTKYDTDQFAKSEILVVEDNVSDLKLMSEILTDAGYRVRPADNGELALRSVQAKLPDLFLLDINLPGMSGVDVCSRLKADPKTKDIPVIFISALGNAEMKVKALEAGAVDYVTKPIEPPEILVRINTHLNMYRLQQDLVTQANNLKTEIEERKRAEYTLKISEKRYRNLVSNLPGVIWQFQLDVSDNTFSFPYISDGFDEIFDISKQDVYKNPLLVFESMGNEYCNKLRIDTAESAKALSIWQDEFKITTPKGDEKWLRGASTPEILPDGNILWNGVLLEITDLKNAENELRESEERFKAIFNESPMGVALIDSLTGYISEVNPMFAKIAGRTQKEIVTIDWMSITHPDDIAEDLDNMALLNAGKINGFQMEKRYIHPDGTFVWINMTIAPIEVEDKSHPRHLCMIEDITERKQTERNQNVLAEIMGVLNDPKSLIDSINRIVTKIKLEMDFDAVGIRLQDGDDYPYFVHDGFSEDFLITENTLVVREQNGGLCRDENENVSLECTCGVVISGQTDPNDPNSTPGGNWWTNDSIPLLDLPADKDPRLNPRNRCIHDGYCSVALIPIRANRKNVGLLQFNDKRKDRFTPEIIHFFEEVSTSIGVALMRKQVVDVLEKHTSELELNQKRLDALLKLTQMTDRSLEDISGFVLNEGTGLTNSDFGFIGAVDKDETVLTIYAWSKHVMETCGLSDEYPVFHVENGGLWTEPLIQRKSVIVNDYGSTELNKNSVPKGHIPLKRLINVPIFEGDRIVALVAMANKEKEYDETDVRQLALLLDGMWTILKRKDAEEKYRTLFNSSSDAIMLLDADGFIDCNPATLRVFGYDDINEFICLHPADVSPQFQPDGADSITASNNKIKDAFENGHTNFEWIHERKDGSDFQTDVTLTSFVLGDRPVILATVHDITKRKQNEEALLKYSEELKNSNELKDLFTDIMRHDLLNPAGIVRGYTEMLCDMEDDEKKIRFLHKIENSNEKLIDLIETTAKFAKLESVDDLEFDDENIAAMLKIVVDNFKPQSSEKQITLEFKAEGTYIANVNPIIEEVFVNLLSNAIKYSPEKSTVIVDIIDVGESWKVAVTDFGEGILDKHKTLLFDRFERVNKVAVKGSGLGLAIVKRIIELHGGEVGVEDNPAGVGSVFWVTVRKA